jgi:hypothetical protein
MDVVDLSEQGHSGEVLYSSKAAEGVYVFVVGWLLRERIHVSVEGIALHLQVLEVFQFSR